jgi:Icc-related predicted phosphoesterase
MRILALSDRIIPFIYSPQVCNRCKDVDWIVGCGDLPYYYLEYVSNALNVPLFFVRGNHDPLIEYSHQDGRRGPEGGSDLHCRSLSVDGGLVAGIEGCLRYRPGHFQYTQAEMWGRVFRLVPGLLFNRIVYGRALDCFVTHAPLWGIHDSSDLPHQGIKAFRWLVEVFKPAIHIHGHIHTYRPDTQRETQLGLTRVINAYGYQEIELPVR